MFGLLGPNGAGKTTFIKCLAGIYQADSGKVKFIWHGKELRHHKFREKLGYVPQNFAFYDELRADQYSAYIADMKLIPRQLVVHRIDELLLQFGLIDMRESRINTLSVGQKKRLMRLAKTREYIPVIPVTSERNSAGKRLNRAESD